MLSRPEGTLKRLGEGGFSEARNKGKINSWVGGWGPSTLKAVNPKPVSTHNASLGLAASSSVKESHSSGLQNHRVTLSRNQTYRFRPAEVIPLSSLSLVLCLQGWNAKVGEELGEASSGLWMPFFAAPDTLKTSWASETVVPEASLCRLGKHHSRMVSRRKAPIITVQ